MNRRAITQYFCDARRNLCRIVTNPDDSVGTKGSGVSEHLLVSIIPRPLAQGSVEGNVPSHKTLKACANVPDDRPGANYDSSHYPQALRDPVSGQLERGRRQRVSVAHGVGFNTKGVSRQKEILCGELVHPGMDLGEQALRQQADMQIVSILPIGFAGNDC